MAGNALQQLAWLYLEKLYELSDKGINPEVDYRKVESALGFSKTEYRSISDYLVSKDLISWHCTVPNVRITTRGIDEVARIMAARYEEKERLVLQKLYDERKRHPRGIHPDELALVLDLEFNEVIEIISELDKKGWTGGSDELSWILPAGIKEIERLPEPPTPTIVINNPQNSPMSFGPNSSQTVNYNNQPIQEILPALTQLIDGVRILDFPTRDDVLAELEKVQFLAKGEMNAGIWQLIQARLLTTKTALEVASLAAPSLPYWPIVWNYFFK